MPPKVQKSKAAKLLAAQSSSKSKGKKKKWSKGKLREKKNHRVIFTKELFNQFVSQVPKKLKVITIYSIVDLFKINCSLARRGIQELLQRNLIVPVAPSGTMAVYTRNPANVEAKTEAPVTTDKKQQSQKQKGKKQQQAEDDEDEQ